MSKVMRFAGMLVAIAAFVLSMRLMYRMTLGAHEIAWSKYSYSELLINYRGGFVRRGLFGYIVTLHTHGGAALHSVNIVLFWNFAVLSAGFFLLALLRGRFKGWTAALILLIPGGVFHMAYNQEVFHRKEAFFFTYLVLIGCWLAFARSLPAGVLRKVTRWGLTGFIWVGAIVCSFIHEAFVFLCAPAAAYLLVACRRLDLEHGVNPEKQARGDARAAYAFWLLSFVSFMCFATVFHGGPRAMIGIWLTLSTPDRYILGPQISGGIGSLSAGFENLWSMPLSQLQSGMAWWYVAPFVLFLVYGCSLIALNAKEDDANGPVMWRWFRCYCILMVCTMPMYLMGWDWGRWFNAANLSFVLVWLGVREGELFDPFEGRSLKRVRGWLEHRRVRLRIESLLTIGMSFVRRHPSAVVSILLVFALTFRQQEVFLMDNYTFMGMSGAEWLISFVHRHAARLF